MRALVLAVLLALAGCVTPDEVEPAATPTPDVPAQPAPGEPAEPSEPAPEPAAAPAPPAPVTLVDAGKVGGTPPPAEMDVACLSGGGMELRRIDGALVRSGVRELLVEVTVPATSTGLQVGHALDDGETVWLAVAPPGGVTKLTIQVPEGAHETGAPRWTFHQQHNVAAAPQACYTGGSVGGWNVKIETAAP